jgi:DNA-binding transcriptional ArsR family regulator
MADTSTRSAADASRLLPEHGVLSLDEYLAMQQALGHRLRFRAVRALVGEERSPSDLAADLGVAANTLQYHLGVLVDVRLVDRRKRKTPESRQVYTYYRATAMAETLLEDGIEALLQAEWEFLETYGE